MKFFGINVTRNCQRKREKIQKPEFKVLLYTEIKTLRDIKDISSCYELVDMGPPLLAIGDTNKFTLIFFDDLTDKRLDEFEKRVKQLKLLIDKTQKLKYDNLDRFVRIKEGIDEIEKTLIFGKLDGKGR